VIFEAPAPEREEEAEGEERSEWFNILVLHQANGLPIDIFIHRSIPLCAYSLLLISNQFWMGGGRVGSRWGRREGARRRIRRVEGENKRCGAG
jgi:hypothetical protein